MDELCNAIETESFFLKARVKEHRLEWQAAGQAAVSA
jgi:hypothetical protein